MPYQSLAARAGEAALTTACTRSAMTRSAPSISAIFASTSRSACADLSAAEPRRGLPLLGVFLHRGPLLGREPLVRAAPGAAHDSSRDRVSRPGPYAWPAPVPAVLTGSPAGATDRLRADHGNHHGRDGQEPAWCVRGGWWVRVRRTKAPSAVTVMAVSQAVLLSRGLRVASLVKPAARLVWSEP